MKICIISSGRSPFDERFFYKIACSLGKIYSNITIIAPYKIGEYNSNGIKIIGIPKRKSRWNRISVWRNLYHTAIKENAGVYQCEEIDSWVIGWLLKRKLKCKLIFDSHECNIATITQGAPKVFQWILALIVLALEKFLVTRTDHIFVCNHIVRGYYYMLNRYQKVSLLHNAPVLKIFNEEGLTDVHSIALCHQGRQTFDRGLDRMINLIVKLKDKYPDIKLMLIGEFEEKAKSSLEKKIDEYNLKDNIILTGWLNYEEFGKYVAKCKIGLITLVDIPNNMLAGIHNKLFNYMRYGLAVVSSRFPELERVIEEEQCGITFSTNNDKELFDAVDYILSNPLEMTRMGGNGKKAILEKYNWEMMEPQLFNAYQELERK